MANDPFVNPGIDSRRTRMVVSFLPFGDFDPENVDFSKEFTGPAWNCISFTNVSGANPSNAVCVIAVDASLDETKPSVCCIPSNNFAQIKHDCMAQVTAIAINDVGEQISQIVYCGYVNRIKRNLGQDIATISWFAFNRSVLCYC